MSNLTEEDLKAVKDRVIECMQGRVAALACSSLAGFLGPDVKLTEVTDEGVFDSLRRSEAEEGNWLTAMCYEFLAEELADKREP